MEKTLAALSGVLERSLHGEAISQRPGLLQSLDPRVKLVGLLALIIASAASRSLWVVWAVYAAGLGMALLSGISLGVLLRRVWLSTFIFTGIIAFPALFLVPGRTVWSVPMLGWAVTEPGIRSATFLISRVLTSATLALLLMLTTPWSHVLKALRTLRVPAVLVVVLGMTYRYLFLLVETARAMLEARRSRQVGKLPPAEERRAATALIGVLLSKSLQLSGEVYLAMQARGFRGEVHTLDEFRMRAHDWPALGAMLGAAALGLWLGR